MKIYFIVKVFQNGRNGLQDASRRHGIAIFFVPRIQNANVYSLTFEFRM